MKMQCLLVDDEPPATKILTSYIESVEHFSVAGCCHNAFDAMQLLQQKQVDLMFLDIKMPKLLGTEFLRTLRNPPKVIFTTAYKEYAIDAFELDAIDYLLKPISLERFIKAINKLNCSITIDAAVSSSETNISSTLSGFLYFRVDRKMIKVNFNEILYIESLKDYVKVVREKEKPLIVKQSISSLEEMLPENQFIRVHRSYIVSTSKVTAFTPNDIEIGETEIPIGKLFSHHISKLSTT